MAIFDDLPYLSYDVLISEPNKVDNGTIEFARLLEEHDNRVSLPLRNDTADLAFPTRKFAWLMESKREKLNFYRFLYRIRGRQKMMWIPSWREDYQLTQDVSAGSATITVKGNALSFYDFETIFDKHLIFMLSDGSFEYRSITGYESSGNPGDAETLTLDRPFYSGLLRSNVVAICFMSLARLDHDLIEIKHHTNQIATAITVFKTVWNIRDV